MKVLVTVVAGTVIFLTLSLDFTRGVPPQIGVSLGKTI